MPSTTILRIEKNINPELFRKYILTKTRLMGTADVALSVTTAPPFKYGSHFENYMFHGSSDEACNNILDDGFDLKHANINGSLGAGIYFAINASYSSAFARQLKTDVGYIKYMLICRVLLGKSGSAMSGQTTAPSGCHSATCSDIFAVYDNYQAYPEYIVYYDT